MGGRIWATTSPSVWSGKFMKSTFIYSTRVFHMPNVQKAILVKDTNYNKKIVPIYYPAGYLDLLFDLMKTKASVIKTFCFSKEKENFCFAGLSDAAIHHLFWWDWWTCASQIKSTGPDPQLHCLHPAGSHGWAGQPRGNHRDWSHQQNRLHRSCSQATWSIWPRIYVLSSI